MKQSTPPQTAAQSKLSRSLTIVAVVTGLLLSIPLIAMQFSTEVDWSIPDFIVMGALIFITGFSYVLVSLYARGIIHRLAVIAAIGTTFLMIWANLAVGLIGGGGHWGNFLYLVVVLVIVAGTVVSRASAKGMERTMFVASLIITFIAVVALLAGMQNYPQSSVQEIIGVNAFFATAYAIAGLLFHFAAVKQLPVQAK